MTRPYRLSPLVHSGMLHACVADDDNDGVVDPGLLTGASLRDARAQGIVEDNCQFVSNADQTNSDDDAFGDACDPGTVRYCSATRAQAASAAWPGPRALAHLVETMCTTSALACVCFVVARRRRQRPAL